MSTLSEVSAQVAAADQAAMATIDYLAPITIAIINESTVLTDAQVLPVIDALRIQVTRDFASIWGCAAKLMFFSKGSAMPPSYWQMALLDDSDQAGALGYHDVTSAGQPLGKVFVKTTIADGLNWSVTLSHELLEILVDPRVNVAVEVDSPSGTPTTFYSYEVADACEDDQFSYKIGDVLVSDFVTPSWFESGVVGPYDLMGHITAPLQIISGGYIGFLDVSSPNGWQQLTAQAAPNERVAPNTRSDSRMELRRKPRSEWKRSAR